MPTPLDQALWFITAAFSAITLGKLISAGLWRTPSLSAFAALLLVSILRDITLSRITYDSHTYAVAWEAFLPALLLSHAWAAFAAYRAVVNLYPHIGRFAVWLFAGALLVAALLCLGTLPWELRRIDGDANELLIRSMFLLYRWVDGLAAGGLILACGFLRLFPRPLKRMPANLALHTVLLAAYFGAGCLLFFAENLSTLGAVPWLERAHFGFVALLYARWTLKLSAEGEEQEPWPGLLPVVSAHIEKRADFAMELAKRVIQAGR